MNTNTKPSGKMKGSQNIVIQGDAKGARGSKSTSTNPKSKVMAKVMTKYPNKYGAPTPGKVVAANEAAINIGSSLSQSNNKRKLKFIGA